ncbi:hypothetical protein C2E31_19285, partial [Rhodopirellula baltica]
MGVFGDAGLNAFSPRPLSPKLAWGIGELQKLKTLWLTNTKITDAAVDAFSGLPNLRLLDLRGTAVT